MISNEAVLDALAACGALAGFLVLFLGFRAVGCEWLLMSQSAIRNGQEAAFCFYVPTQARANRRPSRRAGRTAWSWERRLPAIRPVPSDAIFARRAWISPISDGREGTDFIDASGRLAATFDILRGCRRPRGAGTALH